MNEKEQRLFMKIRLIRLYAEKTHGNIPQTANDFLQWGVLDYIDNNYELFHIQGDEAIYEDICKFIKNNKGAR